MGVRDEFKEFKQVLEGTHYSIAKGYRLLLGDLEKVRWDRIVWGRFNIPKNSFVYWLAILNRLKTKDRIKAFVDMPNTDCLLCGEVEESVSHLFFDCRVSRTCLENILNWVDWNLKITDLYRITCWVHKARLNSFRRKVFSAVIAALIYWLWHGRNRRLWYQDRITVEEIVNCVKKSVKNRLLVIGCTQKKTKYWEWAVNL